MTWQTAKLVTECIALLAVGGSAVFVAVDLHQTQVAARQNSGQLGTVLNGTKSTLELLDRPCASRDLNGHLLPDGPICELDQAIHDVRKIATSSGKQVEQTGLLIDAATRNLNEMSTAVKGTATALTGTAQQATTDLKTANQSIQAAQPVLAHLDGVATASETTIQTINTRLNAPCIIPALPVPVPITESKPRDPCIDVLLTHIEGTSEHAEGISDSLDKVGKHIEQKIDTPQTKGQKIREWVPIAIKAAVAACLAGAC